MARTVKKYFPTKFVLFSLALIALSVNFADCGYSGTYADVQKCISDHAPTPRGCVDITVPSQNSDGSTIISINRQCSDGIFKIETYLTNPRYQVSCGYWPNWGFNSCTDIHCMNDSANESTTYYSYMNQQTVTYYCDGRPPIPANSDTGGGWQGMPMGNNSRCQTGLQTNNCNYITTLLCEITIDPCDGQDSCCKDPCACMCCNGDSSSP